MAVNPATVAAAGQLIGGLTGMGTPSSSFARSDAYQGGVALYPTVDMFSAFNVAGGGARGGAQAVEPGGILHNFGGSGSAGLGGLSMQTLLIIGLGGLVLWLMLRKK